MKRSYKKNKKKKPKNVPFMVRDGFPSGKKEKKTFLLKRGGVAWYID